MRARLARAAPFFITIDPVPRFLVALLLAFPLFASDLTVGYVSRLPEIDYVWNSSNPRFEGWPAAGAPVTWRANVRSWFDREVEIHYAWSLDGVEIRRGRATMAANAYTPIDLELPWTFDRHRISIAIDTQATVEEASEANNSLAVYTDALAVGFWVEQSLYAWFRAHQHELGTGATSWEDWAQRHVELWNDMSAMAVYPETPNGVLDRWRLQKIVIVPDGALPLVLPPNYLEYDGEPNGMTHPDLTDRTVDLQIGFRASTLEAYRNTTSVGLGNPFFLNPVMLHELGHARYLTDVYAFDVLRGTGHTVSIPGLSATGRLYETPEQGLMNRDYSWIDRYSAIALNRIAGQRATRGNYNDPENVGVFLNDLPSQNRLTIRDVDGTPIADADVAIFQSQPFQTDTWYATNFDATPDLTLRTDSEGRVLVGRNPFSPNPIVHWWRGSTATAIVRVTKDNIAKFGFLEARLFNLAYWRGQTAFADHELVVGRTTRCGNRGPVLADGTWDQPVLGPATLAWTPLANAVSYNVYTAPRNGAPRLITNTTAPSVTATLAPGTNYWWVEANFANCPSQRSDSARLVVVTPKRRALR
jgi:hypothetical protein